MLGMELRRWNRTEAFSAAFGVGFGGLIWLMRGGILGAWPLVANLVAAGLILWGLPRLRTRSSRVARYFGVGLPLLAFYLYYREAAVALAAPDVAWHDEFLVRLERLLWTTTLPFPGWITAWLAIGYHAYVPLLVVATVGAFGGGDDTGCSRMGRMVGAVCISWAVCDVLFLLYPVMGPRFMFPNLQWDRMGAGVLARFASVYQEQGMLRGGAFPSAHVAGGVAALVPLWRWRRILFWVLVPVTVGLVAGAVYFGYHYVTDVVVGATIGGAVTFLAVLRLDRENSGSSAQVATCAELS